LSKNQRTTIGYILKGYPRISETFISNEIYLLEQLGFSLHIFSMRQPRESFTHESVKQIRAAVNYLPSTLLAPLPRLLYHNFKLARQRPRAYSEAFQLMITRLRRKKNVATIKHLLQAGYLVQALLPGTGVHHLHAHFAHSPTSVALFAHKLCNLPFSFSAHAKDIYTSDQRQLQEKIALAKFVVTCTEYNRRFLQTLISEGPSIYRVYHGIDAELFSGQANSRKPLPPYRILSIARLVDKKGLPTVFRALRSLLDRGYSLHYTLIGDGEERRSILQQIHSLGLETVCTWLGTQPHHRVIDEYRKADLFVLGCEVARNGDRDGIPNVFLESMAMGVPVIATRVSAIPELVEDGRTGLLVDPGEYGEMAQCMVKLLGDEKLRHRIITAGRRRVKEEFNNRELIQKLAAVFEEAGLKRA
jgi:glycosyltransferase involved in cell wall biosynthesis